MHLCILQSRLFFYELSFVILGSAGVLSHACMRCLRTNPTADLLYLSFQMKRMIFAVMYAIEETAIKT